jgi:5-methyltetrahydrofolate--homocysteine methyltransferase
MDKKAFDELIDRKKILIADGATGSTLIQRGLPAGAPPEVWVLDKPDEILNLHKDFMHAGAEIILTCTFGATPMRLDAFGLAGQFEQINRQAVTLAKEAAAGTRTLIAGCLGPVGVKLTSAIEMAVEESYQQQAAVLDASGVDLLLIETQYDLAEAGLAVKGVRAASNLPLVVSFTFTQNSGTTPSQFAAAMQAQELAAIGINCGIDLENNLAALKELAACTSLPLWFKPNAGLPRIIKGNKAVYDVTPEIMAAQVPAWIAAGARIIGGCCGTSPAHLKAISEGIRKYRLV